jgi:hypothetical protein
MLTKERRNPDSLLPVEDFEHIPLLKAYSWTRDVMIDCIKGGFLEGNWDGNIKRWVTCLAFIKEALLLRAEGLKRRGMTSEELDDLLKM